MKHINKNIFHVILYIFQIFLVFFLMLSSVNAATTTISYVWTTNDLWWTNIWTTPNNAIWNTTTTAANSVVPARNTNTNQFSLTNFSLTWAGLPFWSVINWIQVDVERDVSNNRMRDWTVQLTKDWTNLTWINRANQANWPTTKTITTYGWAADLWWDTWTYNDLISPNFWVILEYRNTRNWSRNVNVYRVWITIDYTPNNVPTDITLSDQEIQSGLPIWSLVASMTTTDADLGDTHTYSLACNTPWVDDSSFSISWLDLLSTEVFDHTIKSLYNICIRTDDWRWWTFDKNFAITILPPAPNNPPTDIALDNQNIFEALPIWSLVWNLSTTDADPGDTHTYSLACTTPWVDDSSFTISTGSLLSNEVFSFATKSSYDICIRTDDGRWWTFDKNFTISILVNPNIWWAWLSTDIWWWAFPWVNPKNAELNTTTTSAVSTVNVNWWITNNLALTDFTLNWLWIPTNATIDGIQVDVEWQVTNNRMRDLRVQLTKDWTNWVWNNNWNNANWPTNKTITTYWWAADLWWTTWTVADLESTNFWVILQYQYNRNWSADVNVFRVNITVSYTVPAPWPWWVSSNMQIWLKADLGPSTTIDWNPVVTWNDQSWNWFNAWWWVSPIYRDNTTDNLNFNPVVDFNWTTQFLQNLWNWAYSQSYYTVIVPDNTIDWTISGQVPFSFDCLSWVLSSWACWLSFAWLTLWAFTAAMNDEVITHALGSSVNWRSAQIWVASYQAWEPMLIIVNEDALVTNSDIYEKWLKVDNFTANTYQTLSTADYSLWITLDAWNPFPYDWKIAEIINYNSRTTDIDRQKIESYLALKYGITLNSWAQNYTASDWITSIWNSSIAWTYINDIFWIWRDDFSTLWQVKSKSSNSDWVLVIEAIWEWTNLTPSFTDIGDMEFLTISNDGWWNTWTATDSPSWYNILSRKWRIQETWELGTVNLDFEVWNINFDIPATASWTTYYFLYDNNNNDILSDDTPVALVNTSWNIWQAWWVNLNNLREFTIATAASTNNIPTDITLSNNVINENVSTWTTIWTFSTTDADPLDTHTYSFVAGAWDADNIYFTILWTTLTLNHSPDFEIKPSYSIRVMTDDWNGWQFQKVFTININNIWEWLTTIIDFEDNLNSYKYTVTSWNWSETITNPNEWLRSMESNNWWLNNTQSCFEVTQTLASTWTITFDYEVSSQATSDFLRFYIDNIEQNAWSWTVPWATYIDNTLSAGTHSYKWCYIKDWAGAAWTDNAYIDYITFQDSAIDITPPNITAINFASWSLLPWWNHNIIINYSDLESWIDITSDIITLNKWDWISAWWPDISVTWLNLWAKVITATTATYPTNNLDFWKYRYNFQISDNTANSSSTWATFYIDIPELTISTGSLDIWNIPPLATTFSPLDFTITVKTIWAWFDLILNKDSAFIYSTAEIIDRNWLDEWVWYDTLPYTSTVNLINPNEVIATQVQSINTNWDKNTYLYWVKFWARISPEQAAWNYSMNINFWLNLNY